MHAFLFVGVLFAVILSQCSAQAPGDGDTRCTEDEDAPTYPDNEKTLMDSYHYLQLLPGNGSGNIIPGAVWNDRSVDGNDDDDNTINPTYWQQGAGGVCRFQVRVCGWERSGATQNNWLFTQHISKNFSHTRYSYPVEIKVHVIYALQSCRERLGCDIGFRLHNYTTNTRQLPSTTRSGYMNTDKYEQFGRARSTTQSARFETHTFTLDPSDTGFYVALQDTGTCVGISRLRVYRYNCPSRQVGLVLYPEVPAKVSGSVNVKLTCVDNASIPESESDTVTCSSDGKWSSNIPLCECDLGYENRTENMVPRCVACPAGQYRSANNRTCQQCPANTIMTQAAAPECECLDGYFRNNENRVTDPDAQSFLSAPNEQPNATCTKPPGPPQNVMLTSTPQTIAVSWPPVPPMERGGRSDLYYKVEYSDPDNLGSFTGAVYLDGESTSHTFNDLMFYTSYCIRVSAHNGVSDQDPDRSQSRMVENCTTTPEGTPSAPTEVQGNYPYVVWNVPDQPNGIIIGYKLTFTRTGTSTQRTNTTDNDQTFYVIQSGDIPWSSGSITIKVKARTRAGYGPDSSSLDMSIGSVSIVTTTTIIRPTTTTTTTRPTYITTTTTSPTCTTTTTTSTTTTTIRPTTTTTTTTTSPMCTTTTTTRPTYTTTTTTTTTTTIIRPTSTITTTTTTTTIRPTSTTTTTTSTTTTIIRPTFTSTITRPTSTTTTTITRTTGGTTIYTSTNCPSPTPTTRPVVEDIEVTLGYVHITWDTNGEEVTLEFIYKEKDINTEKLIHSEKVTKDYYKLNMSATWLENIPKNDIITLKITPTTESVRKRRDVDNNTLAINITDIRNKILQDPESRIAAPQLDPETDSVVDGTSIAISILVTFIVTAIAVAFLGIVVGLVLHTYYIKKKQQKNAKNNSYWMAHSPQDEKTSL